MKEKLKYFPITSYSIIMGLSGLTIVFSKFYHMQLTPKAFYAILLFITFALFLAISFIYGLKAIRHFEEVKADFNHRIRINFFSAISISILLLSIAFMGYWPFLSMVMWWVGTILHTIFMFYTISYWIRHNFEIQTMNPAWFIPVVGNILIPVAGVEYMPKAFSFFILLSVFSFGLYFYHIFKQSYISSSASSKFIPTLFILIAPPAIGFIAYIRIAQSWDSFAISMLFIAYFFVVLLLFLYKSFKNLQFFISWWAFTFPLMAITIASVVAYQISHQNIYKYLAFLLIIIAISTVLFVACKTIGKIKKGEICVNED